MILYTIAKDSNGNLVRANDAKKGITFFCPVCNNELLLRKSGNTGKYSKRPHFAHKLLTPNCTPETVLHFSFKTLLTKKIQQHIDNSLPLNITWICQHCRDIHSGNLLKKIKSVRLEYKIGVCQPDITLLDIDEKVFAVIEIVVTHKPERQVLNYYKTNNIILIQIELKSDNDIYEIDSKISNPDLISICFNPKCKNCRHYLQKKIMTIIDGPCWKCNNIMKIATISSGNCGQTHGISTHLGPSYFTAEEIFLAKTKGVILKTQYSKTAGNKYLANSCLKCGSFAGDFYLFTDYIVPAEYGKLPSKTFEIGYYCEHCVKHKWT